MDTKDNRYLSNLDSNGINRQTRLRPFFRRERTTIQRSHVDYKSITLSTFAAAYETFCTINIEAADYHILIIWLSDERQYLLSNTSN